ncbi:MAG: hypothetical protein LC770_04575 [Acidobacteria bacterium]|nr:hypothetical protein [Acidobacteriota bacterium]
MAAFSTAMKDLNRLQEMVSSVKEFTSQWRGTGLVMLNVESISTSESCPSHSQQLINSSAESDSSDGIAPARGIEIERDTYETITEPEVGGKVELVARKKANRNVLHLARAKYAPARHLNEEISAKRRDIHSPARFEYKTQARFEYKTFERAVTLDLPMTMVTGVKTDALETKLSQDFPQSLLGRINRKQWHGKTDNGKREFMLMLKRFERSNSSRHAS